MSIVHCGASYILFLTFHDHFSSHFQPLLQRNGQCYSCQWHAIYKKLVALPAAGPAPAVGFEFICCHGSETHQNAKQLAKKLKTSREKPKVKFTFSCLEM